MNTQDAFARLVDAIREYDNALRLYGAMSAGEQWIESVPALDELWHNVLAAAGLEPEP